MQATESSRIEVRDCNFNCVVREGFPEQRPEAPDLWERASRENLKHAFNV